MTAPFSVAPAAFRPGGPRGARAAAVEAPENATLVARLDVSDTVARFVVRPDGPVAPFLAGQYLALGLRVDGRIVHRPYSTAASPRTAEAHEFIVRHVPDGTFTPHLWRAAIGTRVRLGPPKGIFVLEPDDPRAHLLVASGTGLAPFISMVHALVDRPRPPRIVLVHGVSHAADLVERDRLEAWARAGLVTYVPTVSRPDGPLSAGWSGRTGRIEAALAGICDDAGLEQASTVAYLCGNPGMVDGAERVLRELGFDDVRAERFWGPAAAPAGEATAQGRGEAAA
jgi:ferredoxin--NADP+ reductase